MGEGWQDGKWPNRDAVAGEEVRGVAGRGGGRGKQEVKCHEIDATSAPPAGTSAFRAALLEHGASVGFNMEPG